MLTDLVLGIRAAELLFKGYCIRYERMARKKRFIETRQGRGSPLFFEAHGVIKRLLIAQYQSTRCSEEWSKWWWDKNGDELFVDYLKPVYSNEVHYYTTVLLIQQWSGIRCMTTTVLLIPKQNTIRIMVGWPLLLFLVKRWENYPTRCPFIFEGTTHILFCAEVVFILFGEEFCVNELPTSCWILSIRVTSKRTHSVTLVSTRKCFFNNNSSFQRKKNTKEKEQPIHIPHTRDVFCCLDDPE